MDTEKCAVQGAEVVAYYGSYLHEFNMQVHTHPDRYELMYVADGVCEIAADGVVHHVRPKQMVYLEPGVPHRLYVEKGRPCTIFNVEYRFTADGSGLDVGGLQAGCAPFSELLRARPRACVLDDSHKVCFAIKDVVDELWTDSGDAYALSLLFSRLLVELARCYQDAQKGKGGAGYVNRAKEFVASRYDTDITVQDVARYVGLNHSYLQSLFSASVGCGIMTYIRNLRLDKACFLLKNSSKPVTDIAFECGYNSRQQFGYSFSQRYGMSPQRYRRLGARFLSVETAPPGMTRQKDAKVD